MTAEASELYAPLARALLELHPGDAARELESTTPADVARFLSTSSAHPTDALGRLAPDQAARVLAEMEDAAAAAVIADLDPVRSAGLLARLGDADRARLLALVPERLARDIGEALEFPPGTAGHLMDARVTTLSQDTTLRRALEHVRTVGERRITDIVVTGEDGLFAGVVPLQELIAAEPDATLEAVMIRDAIFVRPMTSRDEVVELLSQHRLASLPVVDVHGRVVGILRHAALVSAARQDVAGDMQQMVGVSREERALASPWVGVRSRLPWLTVNLLTAFLAASVVGLFEDTLARFTAVAVLMPVVAGESGNTGGQALAVTMRGLALREIRPSHVWRVLVKEMTVGLTNGVAIGVVTALSVFVWSGSRGLAAIMFVAMVCSMMAASIAGALIPVALVRLGRDPATAATIFLTTVTDVVGFATFLGLATALASTLE